MKDSTTMLVRLGRVLYWFCLAAAVGWIAISTAASLSGGLFPDFWSNAGAAAIPASILYAIGRAIRYVLAAE